MLTDAFPVARRDAAIGAMVALAGIGAAAGPFVSGLVAQHLGWRWIFYLNVPVATAALLVGAAAVRESRDESAPREVDFVGLVAVSGGVVGLVLAIDRAPDWGWLAPATLAVLAGGLLLLAVFVGIEARVRHPLIDLGLVRNRVFAWLCGVGAVSNGNWCIVIFCASLYLQRIRGLSVFEAGLLFLPLSVGAAAAGPIAGRLARRAAAPRVMAMGMFVTSAAVSLMTASGSWFVWILAFAVSGLGLGLAYASTNTGTLAAAPAGKAGAASGIVLTGLLIAAALAVALAAALVEQFDPGGGIAGEARAVDAVLRIGAAASAVAALLLLVALGGERPAGETSVRRRPASPVAKPSSLRGR